MEVALIIIGAVIGFGAFIFAVINMGSSFKGDPFKRNMGNFFGGHLAAMGVMAAGGLISVIGIILLIVKVLNNTGVL
jgi:hypothetical protein